MRRIKKIKSKVFKPPPSKFILLNSRKFTWIIIALSLVLLLAWLYFSNFFTIRKILCTHNQRPCSQIVEAELASLKGKNILTFKPQDLEAKIKKADISIDSVTIKPNLPHSISVVLLTRSPFISAAIATSSAQVFIDENLIPYQIIENPTEPPNIIGEAVKNVTIGQSVQDTSIAPAITLFQTLREHFIPFISIHILPNRLQVLLKNKTRVIFDPNSNFSQVVPSLQVILSQDTIQTQPKEIDLRFDKPILKL